MGCNKMNKERLLQLRLNKKWVFLTKEFSPDDVSKLIKYQDGMALAYDLFFNNLNDDTILEFAMRLFFSLKRTYSMEWMMDWKNDVFLGKLCSITWKYEEMYELYKSAYDRLQDPPDSLLLLLASCHSVPGVPLITAQEAEEYLQRALDKKLTYEVALMMKSLAMDKQSKEQENYWNKICLELERNQIHTATIIPDILSAQNRN